MRILGLGTDIVSIPRIAKMVNRHGNRFMNRCFQPDEIQYATSRGLGLAASLAGRWAAKEAFLKALGGEIAHIPYHEVTVLRTESGQPQLLVTNSAAQALTARGGRHLHVSISHEREYAVATVVIED